MKNALDGLIRIALLGAERQAATSFAIAWPQCRFLFFSDRPVVDGWDLKNVEVLSGPLSELCRKAGQIGVESIPLCPRWITHRSCYPRNRLGRFDLKSIMEFLSSRFPGIVLPVQSQPLASVESIAKGNLWHRPDATVIGSELVVDPLSDSYGCGIVFQEYFQGSKTFIAVGRRKEASIYFGVFAVHRESFGRDDSLIAAETERDDDIADKTIAMLEALGHQGFFTFNWLRSGNRLVLSSFRPVPRAVFCTLTKAGIDCLSMQDSDIRIAMGGYKFIADIHYTSYGNALAT